MEQKLQCAKHQFFAKQFDEAKESILEIIESNQYQHNDRLYSKLGDICIELKEHENAKKYYCISLKENQENANTCNKLGSLFHYHLENPITGLCETNFPTWLSYSKFKTKR